MSLSEPGRRSFRTLEGLRGVAAMAVAFMHLGGVWSALCSHAYLAVDLFFLMSGVVIGHAYERRLQNGWRFGQFVAARVTRLAPLYIAGLLLGTVCSLVAHRLGFAGDGPVALNLVLGLAFVPALFGVGDLYPLNPPSWSLLDEALANLAYGAVAGRLSDGMLKAFVGLGLAALTLVTVRTPLAADLGVNATNWVGGLARVSFGFPLGLLMHRLHVQGRLPRWRGPAPLLLAVAVASFVLPVEGPLYDLAMIVGLYPALVALSLDNEPASRGLDRWFGLAGLLSYPLYILHDPPARLFQALVPDGGARGALAAAGAAAALLVLAFAADRYVDRPLRAWFSRRPPRHLAA